VLPASFIGHKPVFGADKPNIILIYVDDFPWYGTSVQMEPGDVGSHTSYQRTPNIQALASQGVTFSRAYAPAGLCGPSRASLQLGQSTARSRYTANTGNPDTGVETPGIQQNQRKHILNEPNSLIHLPSERQTLGEAMQAQGYATAHYGKWHVYGGGPANHGYDASDGETSNAEGNSPDPLDPKRMFSITQQSMDFMDQSASNNKPFYIQLSHYAGHNKAQFLPETMDYYEGLGTLSKKQRQYSAMTEDLDTTIGMLRDKVAQLGEDKNTYFVFTADNGKGWETGDNYLRGEKWWLWDDAIRVPMIISGPGVRKGRYTDVNVDHTDLYPTFVDFAGGDLEQDIPEDLDGESLKELLNRPNRTPDFADRNLYFHYPHTRTSTPQSAVVTGTEKLLMFYERPDEL
ncbi:MAG: sulfatase-like hydrolase/transferase, partial [Planctomycetota bacterium]